MTSTGMKIVIGGMALAVVLGFIAQHTVSQPLPEALGASVAKETVKCHSIDGLPDSACTPGVIDPRVTQANIKTTICKSGYTATVRPPVSVTNKIKAQAMKDYGLTGPMSDYELDHLESLQLGGSPTDTRNLFPEAYAGPYGARVKDQVEDKLHRAICAGTMTLKEAQDGIRKDWKQYMKKDEVDE
jgi:hypothetical protein